MSETNTTSDDALADELLWGAAAIGQEIGVGTRKAFHLLETRKIPAQKIGGLWVASRQKLRRRLVDGEAA
jgi:nucleotidyltransferase/DNA polymerase involved in DNA repair